MDKFIIHIFLMFGRAFLPLCMNYLDVVPQMGESVSFRADTKWLTASFKEAFSSVISIGKNKKNI